MNLHRNLLNSARQSCSLTSGICFFFPPFLKWSYGKVILSFPLKSWCLLWQTGIWLESQSATDALVHNPRGFIIEKKWVTCLQFPFIVKKLNYSHFLKKQFVLKMTNNLNLFFRIVSYKTEALKIMQKLVLKNWTTIHQCKHPWLSWYILLRFSCSFMF